MSPRPSTGDSGHAAPKPGISSTAKADEDEDDALLRRFEALRTPSLPPDSGASADSTSPSPHRATALDPAAHIAAATQRARAEDDDLERIADGRPVDPGGAWGGVREEREEMGREEREFESRVRALRGDAGRTGWSGGGGGGGGGGDEDARWDGDVRGGGWEEEDDIDIEAYLASFTDHPAGSTSTSELPQPSPGLRTKPTVPTRDANNAFDLDLDPDTADEQALQAQMDRLLGLTRHLVSVSDPTSPRGLQHGQDGAQHPRADGATNGKDASLGEWDGETEDEIIQRALDEAALEPSPPGSGSATPPPNNAPTGKISGADASSVSDRSRNPTMDLPDPAYGAMDDSLPALPAVPTLTLPEPPSGNLASDADADTALEARMALLAGLSGPSTQPGIGLPSVPKTAPGAATSSSSSSAGGAGASTSASARQAGQGWGLPGWADGRDDDMDSWCCICNKDATIICAGCDADVYCDECWASGHGPGGEVGHRARRFVWGGKGHASGPGMGGDVGGRRAVGA